MGEMSAVDAVLCGWVEIRSGELIRALLCACVCICALSGWYQWFAGECGGLYKIPKCLAFLALRGSLTAQVNDYGGVVLLFSICDGFSFACGLALGILAFWLFSMMVSFSCCERYYHCHIIMIVLSEADSSSAVQTSSLRGDFVKFAFGHPEHDCEDKCNLWHIAHCSTFSNLAA